jgi:hypothetical protein
MSVIIGKVVQESHLLSGSTQVGSLGRIRMRSFESKVRTRRVERENRVVEL